ncbi:hypothetical protein AB0L66_17880 [Streptomyces sp. NPDC052207]
MRPIGNRETDLGAWWLATTLRLIRASGAAAPLGCAQQRMRHLFHIIGCR